MSVQLIQVQEERAADMVAGGCISTFLLWVQRKVMPPGTKIGKYRYWLVSDLVDAAINLHHREVSQPKESRYAEAQRQARRARRAT